MCVVPPYPKRGKDRGTINLGGVGSRSGNVNDQHKVKGEDKGGAEGKGARESGNGEMDGSLVSVDHAQLRWVKYIEQCTMGCCSEQGHRPK